MKGKVEKITDEEIESFIDMGKKTGGLDHKEHKKIKSILGFDETLVEEIMTPRVKIEAISINATIKEALDFYLAHTHSRIPVYTKNIDSIDYFITSRDLLEESSIGNLDKKIGDINLKEVLKVPLNQSIAKLFEVFQKSHKIMAIVIDEYGGVSGLITLEDIIEEVFGEIRDESDNEIEEFIEIGKNSIRVESDVLIEDVLERFDLHLEDIGLDKKEFDGETLSYVITHILEGFPTKNQIITFDILCPKSKLSKILSFKILDIEKAKIGKIDIRIIKKEDL